MSRCSPFFWTFLEMGWGSLRVFWWSWSPSTGLILSWQFMPNSWPYFCWSGHHRPEVGSRSCPTFLQPLFLATSCSYLPTWIAISIWGRTTHWVVTAQASTICQTLWLQRIFKRCLAVNVCFVARFSTGSTPLLMSKTKVRGKSLYMCH